MAYLEIYQADTRTLPLHFTDDNDVPINVSGFLVRGVAKQFYTDSNADAIINKVVTGAAPEAITGLVYFPITTGDSNHCPSDYLLDFIVTDLSSGRSTYATDGLRILPSTYV